MSGESSQTSATAELRDRRLFGPFQPPFSAVCILKLLKSVQNVKYGYERIVGKLLQFLSTNPTKRSIWPFCGIW